MTHYFNGLVSPSPAKYGPDLNPAFTNAVSPAAEATIEPASIKPPIP
ncbi:MAG: hypothetical protein ACT4OY_08940 [Alphaproteobacteria bacterium]